MISAENVKLTRQGQVQYSDHLIVGEALGMMYIVQSHDMY